MDLWANQRQPSFALRAGIPIVPPIEEPEFN